MLHTLVLAAAATAQRPERPAGGGAMGGGLGNNRPGNSGTVVDGVSSVAGLGTVARTTAAGGGHAAGEDIYGPFEAGFSSQQDRILQHLGCSDPSAGYVVGGISPFGQKQVLETFVDEWAMALDEVFCSGGRRGLEVIVPPDAFAVALDATFASIAAWPA